MKKFLFFAASAIALFASCQKTEINYQNGPQEIALFAVNKGATKTPISNTSFPGDYDMKVAAYMASGFETPGDFFNGTLFTKGDTYWTGKKYWPVSTSAINFLAVAVPQTSPASVHTGTASVVFGEENKNFVKQAVVTFAGNETRNETSNTNYSQFDLMYAAGQGAHTEGGAYSQVDMKFKHALSWIKFTVATNIKNTENENTYSMQVNSIRLSKASYGGTLTLTTDKDLKGVLQTADYTPKWTNHSAKDNVYVPNEDGSAIADVVDGLAAYDATPEPFGNGLLVVPCNYSEVQNGARPTITINYTMNQGNGNHTFERTVEIPQIEWKYNTIYTYALSINLTEIEINPSVTTWDSYDPDSDADYVEDYIPVPAV